MKYVDDIIKLTYEEMKHERKRRRPRSVKTQVLRAMEELKIRNKIQDEKNHIKVNAAEDFDSEDEFAGPEDDI